MLDKKSLSKMIRDRKKKAMSDASEAGRIDPSTQTQDLEDSRIEEAVGFKKHDAPKPKDMSDEDYTKLSGKERRSARLTSRLRSFMKP